MNQHGDDLNVSTEHRLRRGLALLAEEAAPSATTPTRARQWTALAAVGAAAAVVALAIGVGPGMFSEDGPSSTLAEDAVATVTPTTPAPPVNASAPSALRVSYDLHRLVAESPRIVVGTIVAVDRGSLDGDGGMDYVLGTVRVEETLRGPAADRITAFDYDYGAAITSEPAMGANMTVGSRVLLFLADSTGTVHESVTPRHWQVTGGAQGMYVMDGDEPRAPFALDQVRAEISRAQS